MVARHVLLGLLTVALAAGCFVDRRGTKQRVVDAGRADAGEMDAGPGDAGPGDAGPGDAGPGDARAPYDANCGAGTVDENGDPADGCECTIARPPTEVCNGVDDDCDPATGDGVDEPLFGVACDGADTDRCRDGFWVCNLGEMACTDPLVDTPELCGNTVDENCNGLIDEPSAADALTFYLDADMDGYGDPSMSTRACTAPPGYVATGGDCDDSRPDLNPGRMERCNGRDDNCSGLADDAGCPCPVRRRGGIPYMFCNTGAPWSGAAAACAPYGYRLVKVEDAAENTWLATNAADVGIGNFWIGLSQSGSHWDWTDGTRASYLPWASGEPNDGNDLFVSEDCVESYGDGSWNDQQCNASRSYVCEWP